MSGIRKVALDAAKAFENLAEFRLEGLDKFTAEEMANNLRAALDAPDVGLEDLARSCHAEIVKDFGFEDGPELNDGDPIGLESCQIILRALQQSVDGQREADADRVAAFEPCAPGTRNLIVKLIRVGGKA